MKIAKALVGALVAAGGTFLTAIGDGVLTGGEIGMTVGALLTGLGLVWLVPNAPDTSTSTAGHRY